MNSYELKQIETNLTKSRKLAEMGKALERLCGNRDFKEVVIDGYFNKEAIRLVHLKADPTMQDNVAQKGILMQMDAIGTLSQYLEMTRFQASLADKNIAADEQTRDDLLAEGN